MKRRVAVFRCEAGCGSAVRSALLESGLLERVGPATRVALKPNLTYPYHLAGVTTSPAVIRETVKVLRERTGHITLVESDGGYGAWSAEEAFTGHGLYALGKELGAEVRSLSRVPREMISFKARGRTFELPLPTMLLHETDLLITMPVPKIHSMTGVSLGYKNQWGCIPDKMRLRRHYVFEEAIVAINQRLRPAVLADGTHFLNRHGPMVGEPIELNLIIGASDVGAFDRYVSEMMGIDWRRVGHLRRAARAGDLPHDLSEITCNALPREWGVPRFRLKRTPRDWIALAGFRSRFLTWFGYESWFGRVVLHAILYAICGKPVKPKLK